LRHIGTGLLQSIPPKLRRVLPPFLRHGGSPFDSLCPFLVCPKVGVHSTGLPCSANSSVWKKIIIGQRAFLTCITPQGAWVSLVRPGFPPRPDSLAGNGLLRYQARSAATEGS
jgi:hypothetical protein